MKLKDLQEKFARAVMANNIDGLESEIINQKVSGKAALSIYHNNYLGSLTNALSLTYHVIRLLVGKDFFKSMAHEYIKGEPPRSSNLDDYGGNFPTFIEGFKPAESLFYLADMASFEWKHHLALIAPNAPVLTMKHISYMPLKELENIKFIPHPSLQFFASIYPIDQIWLAHETKFKNLPVLDTSPLYIAMYRKSKKVQWMTLSEQEFKFATAIAKGHSIYNSFGYAGEIDFSNLLQRLIVNEAFTGCS